MTFIDRPQDIYDKGFFDRRFAGTLESARVVAPIIWDLVHPQRVVDVGCGDGAWLRAFREIGVDSIQGFDGDYVDRGALLIPPEAFVPADLTELTRLPGAYNLAICLEGLEHLTPQSGRTLVAALTESAPVVLFSAAVPGQGGTNHINEQWPEYWRKVFEAHGYRILDPIRARIRDEQKVKWWYRQNILMLASDKAISENEVLEAQASREPLPEIEWVHISLVRKERVWKDLPRRVTCLFPVKLKKHLRRPLQAALSLAHLR